MRVNEWSPQEREQVEERLKKKQNVTEKKMRKKNFEDK